MQFRLRYSIGIRHFWSRIGSASDQSIDNLNGGTDN